MVAFGVYFVTPSLGFKMTYLRRLLLSLHYARTAPGQEVNVAMDFLANVVDCKLTLGEITLRDHLLHALEGTGIAMRDEPARIPFDIEYIAALQFSDRSVLKFV